MWRKEQVVIDTETRDEQHRRVTQTPASRSREKEIRVETEAEIRFAINRPNIASCAGWLRLSFHTRCGGGRLWPSTQIRRRQATCHGWRWCTREKAACKCRSSSITGSRAKSVAQWLTDLDIFSVSTFIWSCHVVENLASGPPTEAQ